MEGCKKKHKVRTQECGSSEKALKIYFITCLHAESYHSTAVIKMVERLSKDYIHYFITKDICLN